MLMHVFRSTLALYRIKQSMDNLPKADNAAVDIAIVEKWKDL
jgi:hypothetical protein